MSPFVNRGIIKDEAAERHLFQVRALVVGVIMALLIILLGGRFAWLQIGEHESYVSRSDDNRMRLRAVAPNRGVIRDRNGVILAENVPAYRLELVPERVPDLEATLDRIRALIDLSDDEIQRFRTRRLQHRPFERIPLRLNLNEEDLARLAVNRHQMAGVEIQPYLTRHYPYGELLAHAVGYVGRLDTRDLQRINRDNYRATSHIGKTGIERTYEDRLHGRSGLERVETNASGRVLRTVERTNPEAGDDLTLSLDVTLQEVAYEALGLRAGAVVGVSVRTGEVLILVSKPSFDPNQFVHGVSRAYYASLLESPLRPLFNRFLSSGYEPGSTIKPFVALAGLESGLITPTSTVHSVGHFRIPGQQRRYRDWRRGGHGVVNLERALEESVNVYFYQLAHDLGIDPISTKLAEFGFGSPTGIDLPGEVGGVLPSREWKRAQLGQPWYPGETVIAGIGQGFQVVTPLQLAYAMALLGSDQPVPRPRLVRDEIMHATGSALNPAIRPEHREALLDGLAAVIHGSRGTARAIAPEIGVALAGKTGTSQVYGRPQDDVRREDEDTPDHLRNHALFTALAPLDDPEIALVVVVEHGGGGASAAAPVAARILGQMYPPAP